MDPAHIIQIGTGFLAAKTLLSAVELEIFSKLKEPLTGAQLGKALGVHDRAIPDFPDTLVALGLLARDGDGPGALYKNTPEGAMFLDKASPAYIGGFLEMANARLYPIWADLTTGLKTGEPQNEIKHSGASMFETLYADHARLEQFMNAMAGISAGNFKLFAEKFDFSKYKTLCDVGGATAQLSCFVAAQHPQLRCQSFDLPPVKPIAERRITKMNLSDRVQAVAGDFFADALPKADVITMGMILHDWNLEKKKGLIKKAYDALPPGGAFVAIEAIIDDARRTNAFGLLMSLNMMLEFGDAFDYSAADFRGWCEEAGFREFNVLPLAGPSSAVIAYK